jgi:hypothetical protein
MVMAEDKANVININGTDYDFEKFDETEKGIISQIRNCQAKVAQLQSDLQIIQVSQEAYTNTLIKRVEEKATKEVTKEGEVVNE